MEVADLRWHMSEPPRTGLPREYRRLHADAVPPAPLDSRQQRPASDRSRFINQLVCHDDCGLHGIGRAYGNRREYFVAGDDRQTTLDFDDTWRLRRGGVVELDSLRSRAAGDFIGGVADRIWLGCGRGAPETVEEPRSARYDNTFAVANRHYVSEPIGHLRQQPFLSNGGGRDRRLPWNRPGHGSDSFLVAHRALAVGL